MAGNACRAPLSSVSGLGEYLPDDKYDQIGPNCSTMIFRHGVYQVIGHERIVIAVRPSKEDARAKLEEYRTRQEMQKWRDRLYDFLEWQPGQSTPSWYLMKNIIYDRDRETCWVCRNHVSLDDYELGHLHDRVCGGTDTPDNLVVMCRRCNRARKPLHESIGDALEWLGLPRDHVVNRLNAGGLPRVKSGACNAQ
jgi:5-methylcytosine-specific restriction endonuclease McrA